MARKRMDLARIGAWSRRVVWGGEGKEGSGRLGKKMCEVCCFVGRGEKERKKERKKGV